MLSTKSAFEFIAISFPFFRAIILIRIWFRKGSFYGLSAFWYPIISFTIECFIFILFIIDYLIFIFLTWYVFISFFSFEYFSFITLCSFWCAFFWDFYVLLRIGDRVYLFALLCFDIFCQGLRYHEVLLLF